MHAPPTVSMTLATRTSIYQTWMLMNTLKKRKNVHIINTRMVAEELLDCRHHMCIYLESGLDTVLVTCDICNSIHEEIHVPSVLAPSEGGHPEAS